MNAENLINTLGTIIVAQAFLLLIETILLIRVFFDKWREDTDEQIIKLIEEKTRVK